MKLTLDTARDMLKQSKEGRLRWERYDGQQCCFTKYKANSLIISASKSLNKSIDIHFLNEYNQIVDTQIVSPCAEVGMYDILKDIYDYADQHSCLVESA